MCMQLREGVLYILARGLQEMRLQQQTRPQPTAVCAGTAALADLGGRLIRLYELSGELRYNNSKSVTGFWLF